MYFMWEDNVFCVNVLVMSSCVLVFPFLIFYSSYALNFVSVPCDVRSYKIQLSSKFLIVLFNNWSAVLKHVRAFCTDIGSIVQC